MISFQMWREVNAHARAKGYPTMSRPEASIVALIREEGRMMSGIELAERLGLTVGQTFQALKFLTMAGYLGDGVE